MRKLKSLSSEQVLFEDFLKPLGLTQSKLAGSIKVLAFRIRDVIRGRRAINAELALRLARFFGSDARSRFNPQV